LYNPIFAFNIFIYIFNFICYDLVFGRYREHPDSDSGDSGSVAIVGKRATILWLVSECFPFLNFIYLFMFIKVVNDCYSYETVIMG